MMFMLGGSIPTGRGIGKLFRKVGRLAYNLRMRLSYVTSHALRYFLAVLLVAVVTAAFFTMREALETSIIALLYLLPVVLITVLWVGAAAWHHHCRAGLLCLQLLLHQTVLHAGRAPGR